MNRLSLLFIIVLVSAVSDTTSIGVARADQPAIDPFNSILGAQSIGASYQFSDQPKIVETSRAARDMGSNIIKFALDGQYARRGDLPKADASIHSLKALAQEPSFKTVLDMPFAYYILWATAFDGPEWRKGLTAAGKQNEYQQMYDLTCHLLKSYSGSHKTFLLGHWEGDWLLRGSFKEGAKATAEAVEGMIAWLDVRQHAVDDAKRDTPHREVEVFHYTEVNRVKDAIAGATSVTNDVLPKTHVDFVSYSCYDSQQGNDLARCLDYIESKLPPKDGISGKRVFIGEYGFPAETNSPRQQDLRSRKVMRTGLEWGCPFVLYWAVYNNEVKQGRQVGYWLIDDKGVRQPVYRTHQRFYAWAKQFLKLFGTAHNAQAPDPGEFRRAAIAFMDSLPDEEK